MTRNIFGWSYPPGCSGPPDEDVACDICGVEAGTCECPECPECGTYGDLRCYSQHGMVLTDEQRETMRRVETERKAELEAENAAIQAELEEWGVVDERNKN